MEESMMADSICKKLDDYWQILDTSTTILTILNSNSKLLTFSFRDQRDTAINQLHSKMVLYTLSQDLSNSNDIVSKDTSTRSFFENLIMQQQNETRPLEGELERYLALPLTHSELLSWWHQYASKFPILSKMAHNYLAI